MCKINEVSHFHLVKVGFKAHFCMAFTPQLLPLPTLTLNSTILNNLPNKLPNPSISVLFPESTIYRVPNNPFRGALTQKLKKEHKQVLQDVLSSIRVPFF